MKVYEFQGMHVIEHGDKAYVDVLDIFKTLFIVNKSLDDAEAAGVPIVSQGAPQQYYFILESLLDAMAGVFPSVANYLVADTDATIEQAMSDITPETIIAGLDT